MNKNRYLLCLLVCGMMLNYAVPNLSLHFHGEVGVFSLAWLFLSLLIIAGNLAALLYEPKKGNFHRNPNSKRSIKRERAYH